MHGTAPTLIAFASGGRPNRATFADTLNAKRVFSFLSKTEEAPEVLGYPGLLP
jgi:hypothetical protein